MQHSWIIEHESYGVFISIDGGNSGGPHFSSVKNRKQACQFDNVNNAVRYLDKLQENTRYRWAYIRSFDA